MRTSDWYDSVDTWVWSSSSGSSIQQLWNIHGSARFYAYAAVHIEKNIMYLQPNLIDDISLADYGIAIRFPPHELEILKQEIIEIYEEFEI